ncbi:hypothetical protein O6R08_03865 [Cutibacterium equinum]|uniref:Uncharacterized protein n=1 Tax=Cutibacterium equinum TaxID=3016342 RepID=A0ABY7R1R9_9ACTN|nr:hypothetical protein [Cutibacterium equinum]WCC81233.1 hypothetical protein O6R08_03865 [Cutibacterium equinum]
MLPRPAGSGVGIKNEMADVACREVVRRRQAGLPGTDHDRIKDLHVSVNAALVASISWTHCGCPAMTVHRSTPHDR